MLVREPNTVPFSTGALKANLLRLQNEWEKVQASRERGAIYGYLSAIFELIEWWNLEGRAVKRARRALHLRGRHSTRKPEPFAAVILCTSDPDKIDARARSKWSRVLRYAAEFKDLNEPLADFIKRRGGLNALAARFVRRLGRGAPQRGAACSLRRDGRNVPTFSKGTSAIVPIEARYAADAGYGA